MVLRRCAFGYAALVVQVQVGFLAATTATMAMTPVSTTTTKSMTTRREGGYVVLGVATDLDGHLATHGRLDLILGSLADDQGGNLEVNVVSGLLGTLAPLLFGVRTTSAASWATTPTVG